MRNTLENKKVSDATLREHFAAMAMQGILANNLVIDLCDDNQIRWAAKAAILSADALLEELEKDNEQS